MSLAKQENYQPQPYILREDEKIPLFLIKLWNIVEDPAYYDVIRWDESGYSFHITDPYSFCRNVLPQFFKHNNLNSLIRQLNMYGFRKMTPIERTSLARAESDQDHLEFSHPYFVREHPELLVNIKRKVPNSRQPPNAVAHQADVKSMSPTVNVPAKDLNSVLEEVRQLRERQKNMEQKMSDLVKENEMIWQEMGHMRGTYLKQQQIVNKLVQFLVSLVKPNKQQRLGKRQLLAIDEYQAKRSRDSELGSNGSTTGMLDDLAMGNENERFSENPSQIQINANEVNEVLDSLISEMASGRVINLPSMVIPQNSIISAGSGPIIAEVTDELDQLNAIPQENIKAPSQQPQRTMESARSRIGRKKTSVNTGGLPTNPAPAAPCDRPASTRPPNQTNYAAPLKYRLVSYQPTQQQMQEGQMSGPTTGHQYGQSRGTAAPGMRYVPENTQRYDSSYNSSQPRLDGNTAMYDRNKSDAPQIVNQQPPYYQQQPQQQRVQLAQPVVEQHNVQYYDVEQPPPQLQYAPSPQGAVHKGQVLLPQQEQQQSEQVQAAPIRPRSYSYSSAKSPVVESPASQNQQQQSATSVDSAPAGIGYPTFADPNLNSNLIGTIPPIGGDVVPMVSTPQQSPMNMSGGDPKITFQDSPSDFNEYLNSIDNSINQCRNNIADHWELNHLMEEIDPNEWSDMLLDDHPNVSPTFDGSAQSFTTQRSQLTDTPVAEGMMLNNIPMSTPRRPPNK